MKKRVIKLQKITRYFEQKKTLKVVDLQKASRDRLRRESDLDSARSSRDEYNSRCAARLTGAIDRSSLERFEGETRFLRDNIRRRQKNLEVSEKTERERRVEVVQASTTHRIWEKVVDENMKAFRKHTEEKEQKTSDDLALVHIHLNEKNK
ncbi:MAG: flagellar FliJ family protein [Candidatus Krumholzibacteriota bacterium]|nr:flagellar FliJ family protein [Candidatus Krumholzibacteriota bacterium]